ncbi:Zinc finger CCHC domain-containing protein 24 [Eumeta japonica]|uniref:Zinc finger CCHC domain-containing protein 24 n=1 Tax=Eumeta variegata TaxID=151549 RepID=A0A4C1X1W6_EUMVA|nr:Zinc finger CCHC domain-containing protein 24 [Eumeta japonica]
MAPALGMETMYAQDCYMPWMRPWHEKKDQWVPTSWTPFPTAAAQPAPAYQHEEQFNYEYETALAELLLGMCLHTPQRIPPPGYLCHLCFVKGHYIADCYLVI